MSRLGTVLKHVLPPGLSLALLRAKRRFDPISAAQERIRRRLGLPAMVVAGPFSGMRYLDVALGSVLLPKLLGTYELEASPQIESLIAFAPDVLVNVGCGEGYYAVGMALRLPDLRVVAHDLCPVARHSLGRLAALNGVDGRVRARGECTHLELTESLGGAERPAVISDCEGCEDTLLDPDAVPALARTALVVELHEFVAPGVTERLRERFSPTHEIHEAPARSRTAQDVPEGVAVAPSEVAAALDEDRPDTSWLLLLPRRSAGC